MNNSLNIKGLSSKEVDERISRGEINSDAGIKTRSYTEIFKANICTLFNFINVVLAVLVFFTGSYKNMLFMVIIGANVIIGIVQEIRSKLVTDKLSIVTESRVTVIRDDSEIELPIHELVKDDVIRLGRGDQIPSDACVIDGVCKVDESLLTGESKPVVKSVGDELMSGSFINSGSVWARIVHVGADNYAAQITAEAKQHKAVNSEIMTSLNRIIKFVSIAMVPVGVLLFCNTHFAQEVPTDSAILTTTSALIGMIPEGLILLTSTVLAVAVIRLASRKVLVQQLYCIETLARVDTLCLDKTGTITTGAMEVVGVELISSLKDNNLADKELSLNKDSLSEIARIAWSIAAADTDPNDTGQAIIEYGKASCSDTSPLQATRTIPFSSDTKFSGMVLENGDSYVMGAAQFVLGSDPDKLRGIETQLKTLTTDNRVLLVAEVDGFNSDCTIEGTVIPLGFVLIQDQIRSTAAQTIAYFIEQGVTLKVISGDDPKTVSGIAAKVGVPDAELYVDATTLSSREDIASAIQKYAVYGRVTPEQKRDFVLALQQAGHIVAMTGDGVNDVLALKSSDCSVAMASGSDAARNVAQLVLVDNDFASMPHVVAEGRRSINNLQRSASLFLVKTLFSMVTGILFMLLPWQYPFVPIQMTLISAFTIGIPSFVLALEPNHDRVRGHFLINCVTRSIPGAICAILSVLAISIIGDGVLRLDYAQTSTLCVLMFSFIGVMLVMRLSMPYNLIRVGLLVVVVAGIALGFMVFPELFSLASFTDTMLILAVAGFVLNLVLFQVLYYFFDRIHDRQLSCA